MNIDPTDGTLSLPSGLTIGPDLTQAVFRDSAAGVAARRLEFGVPPFMHFDIVGGQIDGKDLLVRLCFFDQMLVRIELSIDLYPPEAHDWSHYSLNVEAETKALHERLLLHLLGPPTSGALGNSGDPRGREAWKHLVQWTFPWGRIASCHDSKGGGTFIAVDYGDRMQQANADCLQHQ
jgi:hypothetical protein